MTTPSRTPRSPRPPHQPGPGLVSPAALRALDLTVRRRVEGLLAGEHRAASLGLGTELAQVRAYEPGDDVRRMDWNVTARTHVPHVRVHVAERALDTWLVLDSSPSMQFGTADRRKADVAEGAALAVAHLATRRGNRLGIITFGESHPRSVPTRAGAAGHLALLSTLRRDPETESPPAAAPTASHPARPARRLWLHRPGPDQAPAPLATNHLAEALRRAARLARRRGSIVIVSDFRGPLGGHREWRRPLLQMAARHDVLALEVRDPREGDLPDVGDVWLTDPETGRQLRVDTADRHLRERFRAAATAERADVAALLRAAGVRHTVLSTSGDWLRPLATFFQSRASRPRRATTGAHPLAAASTASATPATPATPAAPAVKPTGVAPDSPGAPR